MEKLVIIADGDIVDEFSVDKKELLVGRDPACEVHVNDPLVSRHHAKLIKIYGEYYLEDLGSTNGTSLNKRKVKKHVLKHGDVIQFGSVEVRFESDRAASELDELDKTVVLRPGSKVAGKDVNHASGASSKAQAGWVRYLRGPNEGETLQITKTVYTIGQPGEKVAVIARRPQGFFLLQLAGGSFPMVNKKPVKRGGVKLSHGDIIDVGNVRAEVIFET